MYKPSIVTRTSIFFGVTILILVSCSKQTKEAVYKNPKLGIEERTEDLLSRMTLEEKFWQLYMIPGDLSDGAERYANGIFGFQVSTKGKSADEAEQLLDYSGGGNAYETALLINKIQKYFVEETRLGIPIIAFDEALHGLVRPGATAFPQSIALAATWDTTLVGQVATAIAMETKTRGIRQILSPVLNIARDVRWGRTEETYGEDPFLTTQMGLAFISSFENLGIITTPKHFVANVGDGGRDSYPIHFNERLMEEIYFPAFKAAFQKAGAWSVMTSYNSFDGQPCTANDWLLNKKLKNEWGFNGFVISDAGATGGANVLHFTTKDYAESTRESINNGLDVIFQTSYDHYPLFFEAFEQGMIDNKAMDEAVRRVLRAKFKLGLFENPYVNPDEAKSHNGTQDHRLLAEKAALESIVLLKNESNILPFEKDLSSIAVIGSDAVEARLGGYAGPGNKPQSILEGIREIIPKSTKIYYSAGCGRESIEFKTISPKYLHHQTNGEKITGLKGEYFNNSELSGVPALTRIDHQVDFRWTLFSPDQSTINYDYYSARWTGTLTSPKSGMINIGIKGDDGYRLYIDNELILDNWRKQTVSQKTVPYYFQEGQEYSIQLEFYETVGNVWFRLIWNAEGRQDWNSQIDESVALAKKSEKIIICAGIEEGEFRDRAYLSLPGHQEDLIKAVAALGKPTVVVLVGGSAITMSNWVNEVGAILDVWYPGDAGGSALAKVLFGEYNPAGRLPVTFPQHESQLPLYYNHKPTGRGDDYINLTGKPLFPFGFGLSYANFEYSNMHMEAHEISQMDSVIVRLNVKNTGTRDGDEVVQLYIKDLFASVARPIYELKGFKRIHLKAGEIKEIEFLITPDMLTMLDINLIPVIEPGEFRIMIGASSNDIRLRDSITVVSESKVD